MYRCRSMCVGQRCVKTCNITLYYKLLWTVNEDCFSVLFAAFIEKKSASHYGVQIGIEYFCLSQSACFATTLCKNCSTSYAASSDVWHWPFPVTRFMWERTRLVRWTAWLSRAYEKHTAIWKQGSLAWSETELPACNIFRPVDVGTCVPRENHFDLITLLALIEEGRLLMKMHKTIAWLRE